MLAWYEKPLQPSRIPGLRFALRLLPGLIILAAIGALMSYAGPPEPGDSPGLMMFLFVVPVWIGLVVAILRKRRKDGTRPRMPIALQALGAVAATAIVIPNLIWGEAESRELVSQAALTTTSVCWWTSGLCMALMFFLAMGDMFES